MHELLKEFEKALEQTKGKRNLPITYKQCTKQILNRENQDLEYIIHCIRYDKTFKLRKAVENGHRIISRGRIPSRVIPVEKTLAKIEYTELLDCDKIHIEQHLDELHFLCDSWKNKKGIRHRVEIKKGNNSIQIKIVNGEIVESQNADEIQNFLNQIDRDGNKIFLIPDEDTFEFCKSKLEESRKIHKDEPTDNEEISGH